LFEPVYSAKIDDEADLPDLYSVIAHAYLDRRMFNLALEVFQLMVKHDAVWAFILLS
jgi:pentatricopeptide repeat protein